MGIPIKDFTLCIITNNSTVILNFIAKLFKFLILIIYNNSLSVSHVKPHTEKRNIIILNSQNPILEKKEGSDPIQKLWLQT